jgi:hypothetical protein
MVIISICIIIAGILLDVADFIFRAISALKREKVPSAIPIVGFLIVTIGIVGLKLFSEWISIKQLLILIIIAFSFELFMQIVMPLLFTIVCNLIYHRNLLDMTTLPRKNNE